MARKRKMPPQPMEGLLVACRCVGNPDFGQYSPPGPDLRQIVPDLQGAVRAFLAWVRLYNLGGGNVGMGAHVVDHHGQIIARISYNGRVWPPGKWTPQTRPLRELTAADDVAVDRMAREACGL